MATSGKFSNAAWFIFISAIFDGLDGRIARASGLSSDFGLQMDSLSDVVAAGIAPSMLVYEVHFKTMGHVGILLSFLPLLFAAFRLARFNLDTLRSGKSNDFNGMPAPMAAVTLGSVVIIFSATNWSFLLRLLVVLVPLVSLLMASTVRYDGMPRFSLKVPGSNRIKLLAMFVTIVLMPIFPEYILFIFMMVYLISGPANFVIDLVRNREADIDIIPETMEEPYSENE